MRLKLTLAALAAATAFATPAAAQVVSATADAEARGVVLLPLTLQNDVPLDFGTVLASPIAGTVAIDADTGVRTTTGGVTGYVLDAGQRAEFSGQGTTGQQYTLTLNPPATGVLARVAGGPETVAINWMALDNGGGYSQNRTITDVQGVIQFGVGGEFAIGANQREGLYSADFSVTVDYL